MNKHTPQEWADWTGCYVNQDKNGLWYLHKNKPELMLEEGYWNPQKGASDFEMNIFSILISASADHNWTHLYEPNYQKEADSDNKEESYYQDSPISDNKPGHLGEVYTHKEYCVIKNETAARLCAQATRLIDKGYEPVGGIAIGYEYGVSPRQFFYQAMVRGV